MRDEVHHAGAVASLRQFGDETYREKLASGSEAADALFDEADVIVRKYKDVLGEKAEYYEDEYVLDGFSSNVVTQDSPLALHKDPNNTTISCLTGCNPNTDHAPWKGGEFLVADGCYAFDLEPGPDAASHELSTPRNKTGHSSAGCAVLGHDAKNLHGVVPLRPENGKGPEWPENGKGSECVRCSFVQYSKDPCYKTSRGEAEARARGDPAQLKKDAEKAAKKASALARAARNDKRKRA